MRRLAYFCFVEQGTLDALYSQQDKRYARFLAEMKEKHAQRIQRAGFWSPCECWEYDDGFQDGDDYAI